MTILIILVLAFFIKRGVHMFITVSDLVKTYENGESTCFAVNHASFEVDSGEIVVILGPSGSGKSTLMNIIGGLESATSGSAKIAGQEIFKTKVTVQSLT